MNSKNKTTESSKANSVSTARLTSVLADAFKSTFSKLLLVGSPGVGKTALVVSAWKQICESIGGDPEVIVENISTAAPEDLRGLPVVVDGVAKFSPLTFIRKLTTATKPTLCFLDDLGCAPTSVQAALLHVIHGGHTEAGRISPHVRFIGATNDRTHRAGVGGIIAPLAGRFTTILNVVPDPETWSLWALGDGIPAEVVSAVRFRPELFNSEEVPAGITKFACPRSWEHAGRLVASGAKGLELLTGTLGEEAGLFLHGFLGVFATLSGLPEKVLLDPKNAPVPDKYEQRWALAGALVSKASPSTFPQISVYCERLGPELEAFATKGAITKDPSITASKDFIKWSITRGKEVLG